MTLLTHHPLFAIVLTLAAFLIAAWLYRRSGWLVLQPVLVSVTGLQATGILQPGVLAQYRYKMLLDPPGFLAIGKKHERGGENRF